jgi:HEAT repeat protein
VRIPVGGNEPVGAKPDTHTGADTAAIGVFTTDVSLTIRTWDAWLTQATGIAPDAARGRALTDVVPDLAGRGLLAPFQQVLSRGVVEILAPAFHRYLIPCPPSVPSKTFDRMQQRVTIGPLSEDGRIVGTMVAIEDVTARVERERQLAGQLSSLDPDVRLHAANLLAGTEPVEGADPLISAIGDENWRVRRIAVSALTRRKTADMIAAVLQALRDDHRNFSVLSSAIELLAASDVDVVEPLLELLRYPDPDLRLQAALVLGERGDSRAIGGLIEALADPDENLRFHAIEALGKLKAVAAVDALVRFAEAGDFFLAFPALEALAQIGDSSVAPRLAPLMADELLRGAVAEVLGRIGDEDVVPPLTRLLNEATAPTEIVAEALARVYDRYEEHYHDGEFIADLVRRTIAPTGTQNLLDAVQSASAEHLRSITKVLGWLEGPAVERALTRMLGEPSVRSKAVEYLVRHGERVVELLIEQLDAEDLDTRHAAVVGLGRIGDKRATPALLDVLARDPALTVVTAGALARIGDARAFEALLGLVGHGDPAVRQAVIAALNSIGHPDMATRVAPLLDDPEPHIRETAVRIAGYFGYPQCADALLARSQDADPGVRRAAVEHLAFLEDERVVPALLGALTDADAVMRAAAVQALARLDDARTKRPLIGALSDTDPWVRYFAARALGEPRSAEAVDDLTRLALDDQAGHVRLAAIDALGTIASATAIPVLAALSASDDAERAAAAIRALGGISDAEARRPLQAALRSAHEDRRAAAAEALAHIGGTEAIGLLEWAAAADASDLVVAAAIRGLAAIAAEASCGPAAVKALVGLAADERQEPFVIPALAALPASRIDDIALGLRDPRPGVRIAVLQALARMRRSEASRWVQVALEDEVADVRLAALTELRRLGTRGVDRRLVTLARSDPDAVVRRAALGALQGASATRDSGSLSPGDPASSRGQ